MNGKTNQATDGLFNITKKIVIDGLNKSGKAISTMIKRGFEMDRIKGFKPHPTAFLGYIISHESHHRGQLVLSLKQAGHTVDKKILWKAVYIYYV